MRGLKTLVSTTALLVGLALAPAAQAQITISIGLQPTCLITATTGMRRTPAPPWGITRVRILLQRHLSGHGPVGRLGLWPWLGKPSLRQRWRRTVSRRSWPRHHHPCSRCAGITPRPGPYRYSFPCRCGASGRATRIDGPRLGSAGAGDARLGNTLPAAPHPSAPHASAPKGSGAAQVTVATPTSNSSIQHQAAELCRAAPHCIWKNSISNTTNSSLKSEQN